LAISGDGEVWGWGSNVAGQLGDGTNQNRSEPVRMLLPAGTRAVSISAGEDHSLVCTTQGRVFACGNTRSGVAPSTPSDCGISNAWRVAASGVDFLSLVLRTDGSVLAGGDNSEGQLGDGTTSGVRWPPAPVPNLAGVTAISAGDRHALAL